MTDEEAPTPKEQHEASTLARALAGEDNASAPADALEAAALLRGSHHGELSDLRARAIRKRIARGMRSWHWMVPLGALAAAGATLIVLTLHRRQVPTRVPLPPVALLAAQAEAARPRGGRNLSREMVAYRQQVLGALKGRYR
jgi:hypothetical protein